jgi:probable rRNA maturation factor
VTTDIATADGIEGVDEHRARRLVGFLLSALSLDPQCTVSLAFVDAEQMERLHIEWMNEPGPTDVLSFPMDDLRPGTPGEAPPLGILGDIVVCPDVAEQQAANAGHSRDDELDLLLTHGMLHLLGFDHAEPDEHRVMFDLQIRLLERWRTGEGLPDNGFTVEVPAT